MLGDVEKRKVVCLEEIKKWDLKEEIAGLEKEERTRKELRLEFDRILEMVEIMWR